MTALLVRHRQPPMGATGVLNADFMAEVIALPSGLLAMVGEAMVKSIMKLKVRTTSLECCT